ncbi:MAG: FAD:protein FMN transferase [bacterium]|jgi:thiamine biosynthesis lipoprotein
MLRLCVLAVLAAALPSVAAQPQAPGELLRLEQSIDAMGTTYGVTLYGYDRERMLSAVEAAADELYRLDRMLSNYRPDSELSKVNRLAGEQPVRVSAELFKLLEKCMDVSRRSEGAFDISVGPLMKVWGFYRGSGRVPADAQVREALEKVGYQKIVLNPSDRTVRFSQPGMELDPGGIGKGYAVDRVIEVLKDNGITSALVTSGGSSIYALGSPNGGNDGWPVKIRDPKRPGATVADLQLKDESMSTSGSYEKFFEADGKIYSHVMDPRTGYPAQGMLSVSVVAPSTLDSEAWTKPFFILGRQWAASHKPNNFRVFVCEDRAELRCEWLQ